MIRKILVVGGTGMLGEPVARRLNQDGYEVRIFSRKPQKAQLIFKPPFEIAGGDVEDINSLLAAMEGCQAVHVNLHGIFDPDLERRGALMIAKAAARAGIKRLSYLSGASVCKENAWFPDTQARLLAEEAIQASGVPYTIFRAHYFMYTLRNFVRGKFLLQIGRHPHPYQWVDPLDYAGMVSKAMTIPQAAGKILYVCGPQALTMRQALETMQRVAFPHHRIIFLPIRAASLVARLGKRQELLSVLPFFEYCEKTDIILSGSPAEANRLLGAPASTLEDWIKRAF